MYDKLLVEIIRWAREKIFLFSPIIGVNPSGADIDPNIII